MYSPKQLLYATLFVTEIFIALVAQVSKGSEIQVTREIDVQLEERQVWTRQPFEEYC